MRKARRGRRDFGSVASDGTGKFTARWWEGSSRKAKRGFATATAAQHFLARLQVAQESGLLDLHRKGQISLGSVADEWLKGHSAVKLRSHKNNLERWGVLIEFFGQKTALADVTPARIMALREHLRRARGVGPATTNRYLALLRSILNHAVCGGYLEVSPVKRFPRGSYMLQEGGGKLQPPLANAQEAAALLSEIRSSAPEWFAFGAFLLFTGCRRGEAAGLHWQDIDFGRRIATIRRSHDAPTKSGKSHTVPLPTELVRILEEHRQACPGLAGANVFLNPRTGRPINKGFHHWHFADVLAAACRTVGIEPMTPHGLRHAHASLFLMAGGSISDVQRNLNHSTPVLTMKTYAHLGEDHRASEADKRMTFGLGKR